MRALQGTAGECADQAKQGPLRPLEEFGQNLRIDTGGRDMTTDTINCEHTEGEQNPATQFRNTEDVLDTRNQFK
jgi:hypothetical protein